MRVDRREILKLAALTAAGTLASPALAQRRPLETAYRARNRWWSRIGRVERDRIQFDAEPLSAPKTPWPMGRQAFCVVRTRSSLILASDSLSDPRDDSVEGVGGFGMEVYVETPDLAGASLTSLRGSWAFALTVLLARNVAAQGGIASRLRGAEPLAIVLPVPGGMGSRWVTARNTIGGLINIPVPGRANEVTNMPNGAALIAPLTIITAAESEHVTTGGPPACADLGRRLAAAGTNQLSALSRASLI